MTCWKCGKETQEEGCSACEPKVSDIHNTLNRAKERSDNIESSLDSFKEKIKKWRASPPDPIPQGSAEDRDINRCIHYLCLMADDLEAKIASKTKVRTVDAKELEQKALALAELAKKLL